MKETMQMLNWMRINNGVGGGPPVTSRVGQHGSKPDTISRSMVIGHFHRPYTDSWPRGEGRGREGVGVSGGNFKRYLLETWIPTRSVLLKALSHFHAQTHFRLILGGVPSMNGQLYLLFHIGLYVQIQIRPVSYETKLLYNGCGQRI